MFRGKSFAISDSIRAPEMLVVMSQEVVYLPVCTCAYFHQNILIQIMQKLYFNITKQALIVERK